MTKQTISTFLWFDSNAAEAAAFYASIFPGSKVTQTAFSGATVELDGQRLILFNGGSHFKLTPAVSVMVTVSTQDEIDALWTKFLATGGEESRCGWLVDKYGLSWQIIPSQLLELINDKDPAKAKRATDAMMGMVKIDLAALQRAHRGE